MASDAIRPAFLSQDIQEGKYLFLDLNPPPGPGPMLVGAGREVCQADYRIDRPGFEYHTVEFVVGGAWKLTHRRRSEMLHPGAVFAYGPQTAYSLAADEGNERVKYFFNIAGESAGTWIRDAGLADCAVLHLQSTRWIHDLFDQMLDCSQLSAEEAREVGNRLAELILLRIRSDARKGGERRSDRRETFARCRAFIHDHYLEVGTVAEVASRCHVDPAYLARLFQRFSDERPLQLLNRLKTLHAAELIVRHGCTVAQAGQAVGFSDPFHFSRVFKRIHGVSPSGIQRR